VRISIAIEKFDLGVGGAERYCWDLAHYLGVNGHEVEIICMKGLVPDLPSIHINFIHPIKFPQGLRHLSFAILHYFKVKRLSTDINFCVGNTFYMDIYQPHGGLHRAWFERDILRYPPEFRKIISLLRRFSLKDMVQRGLEWWIFKITKPEVIAISEMVRNDIMNRFDYPSDKIHLIPNGIDTKRFSPENKKYRREIRARYGLNEDDFVFLFVANNLKLKGFNILLDAIKNLHNLPFKVLIIGPDSSWSKVKVKKTALSDKVIFGGRADDIERIYPCCDCLIHPTYYDACSLVVLEALASGIPVITTKANGASMYVTEENGYVVSSGDPDVLASAMRQAYLRGFKGVPAITFKNHEGVFAEIARVME